MQQGERLAPTLERAIYFLLTIWATLASISEMRSYNGGASSKYCRPFETLSLEA